jgi:hypothetical protein
MEKTITFKAREIGAIGAMQEVTMDWPERPTKQDALNVYGKYDHVQQPHLVIYGAHYCDTIYIPYPEFYNLVELKD